MTTNFTENHCRDIAVPPERRQSIARGALLAINHSGGKDSQAMTILISRIVPRDQLVAVHAPLGEIEWQGTIRHIQQTLQERVRLVRPATRETMARAELEASDWRRADEAQWRMLWEHEIAELPSHRESRFRLAAGLLLPIWDRLPFENMRVRRLTADTGESLIGRVLDAEQVSAARTAFGLDGGFAMTGPEAFATVMGRGTALTLANGWRLARRRILGADRVEIEGPADTDTAMLRRIGCTVEIVSWRARAFAPGAEVLDRILERWPLAA